MFESAFYKDVVGYKFLITYDSIQTPGPKDWIVSQSENYPIALIGGLPLGESYKWCVEMKKKSGETEITPFHYFSILNTKLNNKKYFKKVQHYNEKNKYLDGIIWCDQYRCAVNRKGEFVWFMADPQNDLTKTKAIRDIQIHKDGSLTLLNYPNAIQTDLSLNISWQSPTEEVFPKGEFFGYHHSIQILPNGNIMVLANEKVNFKNETENGKEVYSESIDFCNIVEFDKKGNVVWKWIMKEHFPYELLINSNIKTASGIVDPHANSFFLDSEGKYLYIGFRDISRIIKIDKSSKEIIASYGNKLKDEDSIYTTDLFRLQHDIQLLNNDNDFLLFNNNDIKNGKISSAEIIHFPTSKKDSFKSKWKFELNYDNFTDGKVDRMGGVRILANGNFLICEGSSNRITEVTKNKKVVWDFAIQQIDTSGIVNKHFSIYRAAFSKTLYPSHFGSYFDGKNILIINKGHENDKYSIVYYLKDGTIKKHLKTTELTQNQFKKIKAEFETSLVKKIEVISNNSGKTISIETDALK